MTVHLDKNRMGQVFANLIGNAIQHGFEGTPVRVEVSTTENETMIAVINNGVPIPADKIPKIFESLVRGDDQPQGTPNLGLGLYITKKIISAHGGVVTVCSSNESTKFTVKLPAA